MALPSGAEVLQVLVGHTSDVTSCDFFECFLASCSSDKSVRLWIFESGTFTEDKHSPLLGHTYGVNCVRFNPFGTLLASCSTDGTVILWSVQGGIKMGEFKHSSGSPIRVCSFFPFSTLLATGGDDEKVVLWDIATKSVYRILDGHEAMVTSLAFSPDSTFLVTCSSSGDIMLWDIHYGHDKCLTSYTDAHDLGVLGCDFSPQCEPQAGSSSSGSYIFATAGNDDLVKLWCIQTGSKMSISHSSTLRGHTGSVFSCRFSIDGMFLASTGADHSVILWNAATSLPVKKLEGHNRFVTCSAFSNSWLLASGSSDKTIIVWVLDTSKFADSVSCLPMASSHQLDIADAKKKNIWSWTVDDVAIWLKSIDMSEYAESFQNHAIDGRELLHLTHENLRTVMKIDAFGKRNKILRSIQAVKNPLWQHVSPELNDSTVLEEFYCPITHDIMVDPVVASDGYSYENSAISEWFDSGNITSPMTNETLEHTILVPNRILQSLIQKRKM